MRWFPGRFRWKLAVLAVVAMAAAGGAAFWAYTALNQAEAEVVRVRWVNVSIEQPPQELGGIAVIRNEGLPDAYSPRPGTKVPVIELFRSGPQPTEASVVFIDATTGEVVFEKVRPEDREAFDAVLATLRLEGPDPPDVWPYSGSPPEERRRQDGNITYIEPDPASGIKVGVQIADAPGESKGFLMISNGRSFRAFDGDTGEIVVAEGPAAAFVDPMDQEAFDRFTSSIEVMSR